MKIFISQPMKGKSFEQIKEEREKIISQFSNDEIMESIIMDSNLSPLETLAESIRILSKADIIYFCDGWEYSNGCIIEHECAIRYGKKTMYEENYSKLKKESI